VEEKEKPRESRTTGVRLSFRSPPARPEKKKKCGQAKALEGLESAQGGKRGTQNGKRKGYTNELVTIILESAAEKRRR